MRDVEIDETSKEYQLLMEEQYITNAFRTVEDNIPYYDTRDLWKLQKEITEYLLSTSRREPDR